MEDSKEPVRLRDVLAILLQLTPAEEHIATKYLHEFVHPERPEENDRERAQEAQPVPVY